MECLHGRDFGYPLMNLAEAYVYRSAFSVGWERHAAWEIHHVLSGAVAYEFDITRKVERGERSKVKGQTEDDNHHCLTSNLRPLTSSSITHPSHPSHPLTPQTLELHGGTFLAIPPRVRHRTQNGSAAPSTRLAMRWSPNTPGLRRGQSPLFLTKREIAGIFSTLAHDGIKARTMPPSMLRTAKALMEAVSRTSKRPRGLEAAILRHQCNDMLINLALACDAPEPLVMDADVVSAMMKYIDEHLGEKLQMRDLMRISGYGSTQLTRLFQEKAGVTPKGYLIRARISQAKRQLSSGGKSLAQIAMECGFPSASYFSTVYHKYCGASPSEERGVRGVREKVK